MRANENGSALHLEGTALFRMAEVAMSRTRPVITVQPFYVQAHGKLNVRSQMRLRGKWLAELFPPYTQVRVTREERQGALVLVLEPLPEAGADESERTVPNGGTHER